MKIAVLSDIHGNLPALTAVLGAIAKDDIDSVIILGDMITDFYQHTNEVLRTIRALTPHVIRGNREGYLINRDTNPGAEPWEKYIMFSTSLYTFQMLSADDMAYIKNLPAQLSMRIDERFSIRAVHGSPFSEFEGITSKSTELIGRSLNAIPESILLCGHTHRPFVRPMGGDRYVVNVGSVGVNFSANQSAQYMVMISSSSGVQFEQRKARYDFAAFKNSCDLSNPWTCLCLKGMEVGENCVAYFLEEAKTRCGVFPVPNDVFLELFDEWMYKGLI